MQRQALKLLDGRNPPHFSCNFRLRTKWATVCQLLVVKVACVANAASKGKFGKEMEDVFQKFKHGHDTRGSSTSFRLRKHNDIGYSLFSHVGPSALNSLSEYYNLSGKTYRTKVMRHKYAINNWLLGPMRESDVILNVFESRIYRQ